MPNIVITFQKQTALKLLVVPGSVANAHFSQDAHPLPKQQILTAKLFLTDALPMEHIALKLQHAVHSQNNYHVSKTHLEHIVIGMPKQMLPFQFVLMLILATSFQQS